MVSLHLSVAKLTYPDESIILLFSLLGGHTIATSYGYNHESVGGHGYAPWPKCVLVADRIGIRDMESVHGVFRDRINDVEWHPEQNFYGGSTEYL